MITEEEKKQLLDDIEKARKQHWLEMMADFVFHVLLVIVFQIFGDFFKKKSNK